MVKNPFAKAGDTRDTGSILEFGRSPGGGNDNLPARVSLPGQFHGQRSLVATVPGVAKSGT